jgi:hypothetical protein
VKPNLLFLAKVLLCSIGLYVIWHPIAQVYTFFLKWLISLFVSVLSYPDELYVQIYGMSLYIIPFISLMLFTPNLPLKKRAGVIGSIIIVCLILDSTLLLYINHIKGEADSAQNWINVLFLSLKLILPLLLWIISSPTFFKQLLEKKSG